MQLLKHVFVVMAALSLCGCRTTIKNQPKDSWTFVSIPDFLNKDTIYPHPGFEESLDYILKSIKAENPDFVLVAGDLVNGRWPDLLHPTAEAIDKNAAIYYPTWIQRFKDQDLKFYTAVGDHEVGDNPWPPAKAKLVPLFKEKFRDYLKMPLNGPDHMKGTAFYVVHKNTLLISLDVFESDPQSEKGIRAKVTGKQLAWVQDVLAKHRDVDHILVMGHTPILGPVKRKHSSGLMLEGDNQAPIWQLMAANKVDLYLCGEVHAITCTENAGVEQVAHGSLLGWCPTVNYLVVTVTADSLTAKMKELEVIPEREGRKSKSVLIKDEVKQKGFRSVGMLYIEKTRPGKIEKKRSGCFQ